MSLDEARILRYSRQILLRQVGGRGQERLLAGGVRLKATGGAGWTAAAYVAAGGTAVQAGEEPVEPGAEGFLVEATGVGQSGASVLERVLPDLNPDAVAARGAGQLAELPATWAGEGPWVALGGEEARGVVVFRGTGACADCFEATTRGVGPPPSGALGVGLGALGALVLQRLLLGMEPGLGALGWEAPGGLTDLPVRRCAACG